MHWRLDLMQANLLLFGCIRKGFLTYSFYKWPLYALEAAERKYTCAISKNMKTYESG